MVKRVTFKGTRKNSNINNTFQEAHVVLLCRNEIKMAEAKMKIVKESPGAVVSTILMDLKVILDQINSFV